MRKDLKRIPGYDPFNGATDFYFDPDMAQRAVDVIEKGCTFTSGAKAGTPFILEPWQRAVILNLFGWYRKKDGLRRYREVFIFVPRKNGKTELAAAIILCVMFMDSEPGMQIYSAAADADQARLVLDATKTMIRQQPAFESRTKVYTRAITRIRNGIEDASYKSITAKAETKHGFRTHCAVIDELHAHRNGELLDTLVTSTGSQQEPIIVIITTSDFERENSPCNQRHGYASDVRDGVIEDMKYLPVIYEASIDDDWTSEKIWKKANPNYGVSLYADYMETECAKAKQNPAYESVFKRLHLNIRTENESRLFDMAAWDACGIGSKSLDEYEGRECVGGLDLGATSDLTALCLCFKRGDGSDIWDYFWLHWIPRHNIIDKGRKHGIDYMSLANAGELTLTAGNEVDYQIVRRDINALADRFGIKKLAVDRLFQGAQLAQDLLGDGIDVVKFGQGFYSMSSPTVEFMRRVNNGTMRHSGSAIMKWQARNTQAEMDAAGNIKPDKAKSKNKIDGIVCAIMCTALAAQYQESTRSVYEDKELVLI